MKYINFSSSEIYRRSGNSWVSGGTAVTVNPLKVASVSYGGPTARDGVKLVSVIILDDEEVARRIYVSSAAAGLEEIKALEDFVFISKSDIFYRQGSNTEFVNFNSTDLILNKSTIVRQNSTDLIAGNVKLSSLVYNSGGNIFTIFVSQGAVNSIISDAISTKIIGQSTFVTHRDNLTDCIAITTVNHTTGATNYYVTDVDYNNSYNTWTSDIIQEGGCLFIIEGNDSVYKAFFINVNGEVVDSIFTGGELWWGTIDCTASYALDWDPNSTLKIFNGTTVSTIKIDNLDGFGIGGNSDSATKDGSLIAWIRTDDGEVVISKTYIIKPNGDLIDVSNYVDADNDLVLSSVHSSYFVAYKRDEDDFFSTINIVSENGTLLSSLNLSGTLTNNRWDDAFRPDGSFDFVLNSYITNEIPWFIGKFDNKTNKFITTTHERGELYTYARNNIYTVDYWDIYNTEFKTTVHVFYNDYDSNYNEMYLTDNADVVYLAPDATEFETYTIAQDSATWVQLGGSNALQYADSPTIHYFADPVGVTSISSVVITPTGAVEVQTEGIASDNFNNIISFSVIGGTAHIIDLMDTSDRKWLIYNANGEIVLEKSTSSNWEVGYWGWAAPVGDTMCVIDEDDYANSIIYSTSLGELQVPALQAEDNYFRMFYSRDDWHFASLNPVAKTRQILAEFNSGNNIVAFYRIDENGVNERIINLKSDDGGFNDLAITDDTFAYSVWNSNDGAYWTYKYDWATGRPLSVIKNIGEDGNWYYGDRVVWVESVEGGYMWYFLTNKGLVSKLIYNNYIDLTFNDMSWWD